MEHLKRSLRIGAAIVALHTLSGCVSSPDTHYHWGHYETLVYDMYMKPGKATATRQIDKLNADIQEAANKGKAVPPGLYAHLGFMYSIEGNVSAANAAFNEEATHYPDSATLINGMLERAKKVNEETSHKETTDNKEDK